MSSERTGTLEDSAWRGVPWDMQNYIFFYLRSRHFPITFRNTSLIAQALARRLETGPIEHRDLEVAIEKSAVEYLLDEGQSAP